MYGKESNGVVRSTVLIDSQGKIARMWRKVAVKGHVDTVIKSMQDFGGEEGRTD